MKVLFCLICIFHLGSLSFGQLTPTESYPHNAVLDAGSKVRLYWKFNETYITFEVHGQTTGWVGVGISPNGGMIDADIYVGWVKNGVASVTDRHGLSTNTFPPKDTEQNIELLAGQECDGWTMIKFQRQIAGCQTSFDRTITSDTLKIIYALGSTDPVGDDITPNDYHGTGIENRGTKSLLLLDPPVGSGTVTETTASFDLLNNGTLLPAQDTYYNCRMFKYPTFTSKNHVIKVEPIIQAGYESNVHHILLYQCDYTTIQDPGVVGQNHECSTANMPPDFQRCSIVINAWAIGGGTFFYPAHVGYPVGVADGPRYVVMETHYDNPLLKSDIRDFSGLRIHYTSQLRQYDAGIMEVGHLVNPYTHLIPPNVENFLSYGECPNDCLSAGMAYNNQPDIKIFGTTLHSHLLGTAITLRHITRNRTELPYIARDNSYDFNYQETRILSNEVTVTSGSRLQLICNYKSKGVRTNFTVGGLGTKQEMCLAYVNYYPKIPVVRCETMPIQQYLYEFFGVTNYTYIRTPSVYGSLDDILVEGPQQYANQTLGAVLHSVTWTQAYGDAFSNFLKDVIRVRFCDNRVGLNASYWGFPINVTRPYVAPTLTCMQPTTGQPTSKNMDMCPITATPIVTTTTASAPPLGGLHFFYAVLSVVLALLVSSK